MDFCMFVCVCLLHVCPCPRVTGCSLVYCMCSPSCSECSLLSGELCRAGPNFRLLMCDVFGALAVLEV